MAEKIKILQKEIPVLGKNLELDKDVLGKIVNLQTERQKELQAKIDAANKESLAKYEKRLAALKETKAQAVKKFDEEIKDLQTLVKKLKSASKSVKSVNKSGKTKIVK